MAVAFQTEAHSTASTNGSTATANKPTGTVDGDLLIVRIVWYNNTTITSVPSGWTLINNINDINAFAQSIYYKQASSEGASWDWGFSAASDWCFESLRFNGHDVTTPIATSADAAEVNTGVPSWVNTITPVHPDSMLVMMIAAVSDATQGTSAYAIATSNPTWTERIDQTIATAKLLAVATATRPEITATGNSSATLGTNDGTEDSYCCIIAINRVFNFTSSTTDTLVLVESKKYDLMFIARDTLAMVESITKTVERAWANTVKNVSTWLNQDKT